MSGPSCSVSHPTSSVGYGVARIWRCTYSVGRSSSAAQALLVTGERLERRLHLVDPARDPHGTELDRAEPQAREPVEHAVEDHRRHREHHRVGDAHVVDRAEVLLTAVEVGRDRQTVQEVVVVEVVALAADVEHDRDPGVLGGGPHRVEPEVARRVSLRARRRHEQGGGAHLDRLTGHCRRGVEVGERHVEGRQQPAIDRAEVDHAAVVGTGGVVDELRLRLLPRREASVVERVEHELAGDTEQVEGARPVVADEAAGRGEVLARHDLGVLGGAVLVGLVPGPHAVDVERAAVAVGRRRESSARAIRGRRSRRATSAIP